MQTWKAVILLTAARHGLTPEAIEPLFPLLEARSKKILRSLGHSHETIEEEFEQDTLDRALHLLKTNPDEFERKLQESCFMLCSKN